ncbi:hypothetical protein PV360_37305 [Streptomyces scabiei]|nr:MULTISPECIES: hypothetical protein [Streptomyces]MBP5875645.1 hypothetical protein [Streptomyces sp. LBUM 1477]MDX2652100.1 hypothetical protein [Streptomyces scabiei]MDX2725874.1 hypothetical protein [Streptomyces scabiei]MDX2863993.1 hypothetical protein [Streptomyces scabiei]MDX2881917.1 hypothetical protein [Streptomyces scabiei]
MPAPTICRMVIYRLTDHDARHITQQRAHHERRGNFVREGDQYPAIVVRVFEGSTNGTCNLKVLLDGEDVHWATSAREGDEPGTWAWPGRV